MSEESVTSARRPILTIEEYRERNNKRAKEYYYKNHDKLKNMFKERAQNKRDQIQDGVKTVIGLVVDITRALLQIQETLKALESQRVSTRPADLSQS